MRMYQLAGWSLLFSCFCICGSVRVAANDLQLAPAFSNHGVLQCETSVPVWGFGKPGEKILVRFADQKQFATVDADGQWRINLNPMKVNAVGRKMQVSDSSDKIVIEDLLVGEVWYASGQSNMQMTLQSCVKKIPKLRTIADEAALPIRMLRVDQPDSPERQSTFKTAAVWQVDSVDNRRGQSAVAYFFARSLTQKLNVPIGVIEGSWGGKPIEGFIPMNQFQKYPELRPIAELASRENLDELAKLKGGVIIRNTAGRPGRIFHSRVAPIAPYGIRGFVWYQGESNAGRGEDPRNYQIKMQALAEGWRETWGQSELPFYYVQLPSFQDSANGWVRLREEQRLALDRIAKSGMAVTIDLHDKDIHPANKLDVGNRLARWALAKTYHYNDGKLAFSGPLFESARVEAGSIRVKFQHADGLMIGSKTGVDDVVPTPDSRLQHFQVADQSGNWHPATAIIDGNDVVVASDQVASPKAVRYACSGGPDNANLYNQAGLPASPFCSDLRLLPWTP